jgi:4-hydroxy-tetrahydrodipicolinate reductase
MKLFLFGYGQMGKEIEKLAAEQGHEIIWRCDPSEANEFDEVKLREADIAIDYTIPGSTKANILECFKAHVPVVVGTTGWYDDFDLIKQKCEEYIGTLFYATNFSIGVNILFKINDILSKLLSVQRGYDLSITESHHTKKKDAPSGTAITLAQKIVENIPYLDNWTTLEFGTDFKKENRKFPVFFSREEGVVGEHKVKFESDIDQISIEHKAYTRQGFALGTLIASEWVVEKKGIYTMSDMLEI